MSRSKTPSFVTELPLLVSQAQEKTLLARLEAARQVYNACLGEALLRREHLLCSTAYQAARAMPAGKERTAAFAAAREAVGFNEYALHHYAAQFGYAWLGEHLDSLTVQALASRAFDAVEKYLFGKRGRPRFKSYGQLDSVEGKTNASGLRWIEETVEEGSEEGSTGLYHVQWDRDDAKLCLEPIIDTKDEVVQHGLRARVKYVRLVRRKRNGRHRFCVQLIGEGKPFHKDKHKLGKGIVGLDLGPSTIAIVSQLKALLLLFCAPLARSDKAIRRLQRKRDRQQQANNPDNYNADGTIRQGKKTWRTSKRQRQTERKLAELYRKQAAYRRSLHGRLANLILSLGDDIRMEKLSYRAFQRRFGRSVAFRAPGSFVSILRRKAGSAGASLTEFPTRTTKLSQTCHQCGKVHKKPLSQRWHKCECGLEAQRDLYSAFLATCVDGSVLNADRAKAAWSGVDALLRAALSDLENQLASGGLLPASFGLSRRESQSPGKAEGQATKTSGEVGHASVVDARRKVAHPAEPPGFSHGE